ncbi:curved DNA-binding protein [Plasticicumulans lactativorans]|uniref:Curved DNA-binding protein n=1 Tax=Plasticicumulans lactativorans TaxID=1133106 RepID=A0A4R2KTB8_9GAMM|nr:DnaJ C-terminal domain-containing protein [Plasticicumulans lactativorans]TCO76007.1 curved DNA-binding protein [Plasticicumulans lactativorans]
MRFKDYYETLGVPRTAGADEIKKAYRRLARKYHPDVSKERNAEERIKEINEAWEVLQDPEKRAAYDQLGPDWRAGQEFRPPPGWQAHTRRGPDPTRGFSGADFSEFFDSLFGERGFAGAHAHGHAHGHAHARPRAGEDQHSVLEISLEEAYSGGTRALKLTPAGGHGAARTLNVKIPPGVVSGQKIRLGGQGQAGSGGGDSGDLYLELRVLPHRLYQLDGRDITVELPVAPWEAALGARIDVPTLGGRVTLAIPAGAQSGQKLRLRGRGLPGDPPGDQFVRLVIVNPPATSDAAQALFRRMRDELAFDPRAALG